MIGTKLAHYEITNHLGTGGMGEVYQATDSKLGRSVAIKLLPEAFAHDTDRAARFEREARVLASLNHPNIAAIHGLEESGERKFLVLELVPGETLAERINRGPLPVEESLVIARQILEALEAAHEKGIIHRDLKPANVKITPDGKVKVLDFGLAKAFEAEAAPANLSQSPTLSLAATMQGVILGTAAYMSPEQAKGRQVDKRTDLFSFGSLLYEMWTGRAAFEGEDIPDILSRVLQREPDWTLLPANLPPRLRELLKLCLQKDVRKRRSDAADVRIDIDSAAAEPVAALAEMPARSSRVAWMGLGAAVLVAGALAIPAVRHLTEKPRANAMLQLSAELGPDVPLAADGNGSIALALSPDGAVLVFVGAQGGTTQLYLRRLGQLQSAPLAGTGGASDPFFSPDGQWIAFFAEGKLKKISVTGGAVVTLANAPVGRGGAWGDDGNIVFTPNNNSGTSLMRVSSAGGPVERQAALDTGEATQRWPQVLPGGRAILYTSSSSAANWDNANLVVQPLPNGAPRVVQRGGYYARYLENGHLVYIHGGTLFAAPFSLDQLAVTGPSVPALEGVMSNPNTGRAQFAASATGTLAFVPGQGVGSAVPMFWMGRDGKTMLLRSTPEEWSNPHFSPDGRSLALDISDGAQSDVWVYDWARDTSTKFTFDAAEDSKPVWTPDSKRLAFASKRGDKIINNLYWQRADGAGEVQRLAESKANQLPGSWHPSGKVLAFSQNNPSTNQDLMILPMEGDETSGWKPGQPMVFLQTPGSESEPMFSPDGRWLAYQSNESGQSQIFVRPFPGPGGKWQISTEQSVTATWSRTRNELYYRTFDNQIMVAVYRIEGDSFKADKPRPLSARRVQPRFRQRWFDLHPDGERFVVSLAPETPAGAPRDKAVFIVNFFEELQRLAQGAK